MNFYNWLSQTHTDIPEKSADAVLKLQAEGATVPFISRYRKEQTGNLNEVQVQAIIDGKENWDHLLKRKDHVLGEMENQKKLTPELKKLIQSTFDIHRLEDIYAPYKSKRKTKAMLAKEAGLEPFTDWIKKVCTKQENYEELTQKAESFINTEHEIKTAQDVIDRSQFILIEELANNLNLREQVKKTVLKKGFLKSKKGKEAQANSKFEPYFDYQESIQNLFQPEKSHRYLALRRGWQQKELSLSIGAKEGEEDFEEHLIQNFLHQIYPHNIHQDLENYCRTIAKLAFKVSVLTKVHNEIHRELKEAGDTAAIDVFAQNISQLLMAAPYGAKAVLGIDPGIRTGCKVAALDDAGKFIADTVIHTRTPADQAKAKESLLKAIEKVNIKAIAVGNGTAGRETETFVRKVIKEAKLNIPVVLVNESGASIYSASDVAREEFPDLDLTVRGAISIARRLQDPLAELVKIDPKSIGVGQYQHDVSQVQLKKRLNLVVETCVNNVGVNLNTASYHLLAHVAGIGPTLAKLIIKHREKNGLFKTKTDVQKISRFNDTAFEQASGFLRIAGGKHPLDNTGVHPERYQALEEAAKKLGSNLADLLGPTAIKLKKEKSFVSQVGELTANDIILELEKPGRDPRDEFKTFEFRDDINEISDLKEGMTCPGVVTNVTNFGAFIDIGVHQDGLVHISQLADKFVKDPKDVVRPGEHVKVWVMSVDLNKKQIALSMKSDRQKDQESKPARKSSAPAKKSSQKQPQNNFSNNPFAQAFRK